MHNDVIHGNQGAYLDCGEWATLDSRVKTVLGNPVEVVCQLCGRRRIRVGESCMDDTDRGHAGQLCCNGSHLRVLIS
jgi:hypothetical protein